MAREPVLETQLASPPVERRFTVGGVVGKTLEAWWRHLAAFTLMSVAVYAPFAVALGYLSEAAVRPPPGVSSDLDLIARLGLGVVAVSGVTVALAAVQAGAVVHGTVRYLQGGRARFGEMAGVGLRRSPRVLATGLLVWLGVVLGLFLLVVPGVVLMVASAVAVPAAVAERLGALGAMRRSFALTRGSRWPLFAAGLAILALGWVLAAVAQVASAALASLVVPPRYAMATTLVVSQLGNVLFSALPLVGMAVAYHELRTEKDGVDTATLARVFE